MPIINLTVREQLGFAGDPTAENVLTRRRDTLAVADDVSKHLNAVRGEALTLQELVSNVIQYHRQAADAFGITDAVSVAWHLVRREVLRFVDEGLAGPNAVYGDLAVYSGGLSTAGLQDLSDYGPAGFGRFRPFRPGLYEFQELYFRTAMRSLSPTSLPRVDEIFVVADVEDSSETGTGEVLSAPSGEAVITFRGEFYETPEIVAIYKSAAVPCDVEVYARTPQGFKAKLKRRDTGAYITGTFTWAALGKK